MEFEEFFKNATGKAPYKFQSTFAKSLSLPDLFEAPTGSGKTATAVLGWMWRRRYGTPAQQTEAGRRLIFCLPMRTLVEQTKGAVDRWLSNLKSVAEGLEAYSLLGGAVDDRWDEHPDQDAILIGTQDQLLSRALMRGYGMSRYRWPIHFALLNNDCTWVMDEVQLMGVGASTAAQLQAFREILKVSGSVKTVWMTATLTPGRIKTIDMSRPLGQLPFQSEEGPLEKRLNAKKSLSKASSKIDKGVTLNDLAKEVASAHERGSLTIVILNRVSRAQELRELLVTDQRIEGVALIHSRFRRGDRQRIQEMALNGAFKGVLVATQAIEAGVDISAKTLFTELAPWSSLVQRFGRLNRAGEFESSRAFWIDINKDASELCLPYDQLELTAARDKLSSLEEVGPSALTKITKDEETPVLPVLRKKDILELFNTEPDLAGHDIDISRYIRASDNCDVQVAWRDIGPEGPLDDAPDLSCDELCRIPVYQIAKILKRSDAWRFDSLKKSWVKIEKPIPGMMIVVDVGTGGYDSDLGFTGDSKHVPRSLESGGKPPDSDAADMLTYGAKEYITIRMHAEDTAEEMATLYERLKEILTGISEKQLLVDAARWHDVGKVHKAFQTMLTENLSLEDSRRTGGPWAKSNGNFGRNPRRFFRHELASALAWLDSGKPDLGTFLVAAHHGKVRMSLRARPAEKSPGDGIRFAHGIYDGDLLPAIDLGGGMQVPEKKLSLACMELGGGMDGADSWADRMLGLLEEYGPFRLAYLEMLIRIADWRASKKRMDINEGPVGGRQ